MTVLRPAFVPSAALVAAALFFTACGSNSTTTPNPNPSATPLPGPAPVPTPTPDPLAGLKAQCGEPMPTPLFGMKVSVQLDNGFRKLVDSRPVVENVGKGTADSYCAKVGFDARAIYCDTRPEGHPQREACDILVVGKATDTGRYGPSWSKDGKPCVNAGSESAPGCTNHAENQFLVISRGPGNLLACASETWPATGSRCGGCTLYDGGGRCAQ
jgi:hypothetical protein